MASRCLSFTTVLLQRGNRFVNPRRKCLKSLIYAATHKNWAAFAFYLAIGIYYDFRNFRRGTSLAEAIFAAILLQRGMTLPSEMPWPFLGVSSLNLAAPSGAAFFLTRGVPITKLCG